MKINLVSEIKKLNKDFIIAVFDKEEIERNAFFALLSQNDKDYIFNVLKAEKNPIEKILKVVYLPWARRQVLLLGLGEKKLWNQRTADLYLRKAVSALKEAGSENILLSAEDFYPVPTQKTATVNQWINAIKNPEREHFNVMPAKAWYGVYSDKLKPEQSLRRIVENILMADFSFTLYKEKPAEGWPEIGALDIFVSSDEQKFKQALEEGVIIGEEINNARILVNTPGGEITPIKLAEEAVKLEKTHPAIKVRILKENKMKEIGMGGILGVSKGSSEKPRFIIIEYREKKQNKKPLVFAGKGVTYDSGGINLKPEQGLEGMHMDMSGGAAVMAAIAAIARLKMKVNVIGLIPAVENMPSGSSFRPGDILKTVTGKTIEVINTDAEGRIILADALGYAQKYKPEIIVDVATLTGAATVALGQRLTAVFAADENLQNLAIDIGRSSGDEVWPLPLLDEYVEDIKAVFGDVLNLGKNRYGGAIIGAIFLKQFVGDFPWLHLDIAPTITTIEGQYLAKGASGVGVRFLVELARRFE